MISEGFVLIEEGEGYQIWQDKITLELVFIEINEKEEDA